MNALVNIETLTAEKVFAPGGVAEIIAKVESEVRALPQPDLTTEEGRDEIKSRAYKIARTKTGLDDLGKEFVAVLKKQTGAIDADRRTLRDRLDALRDEVRKPVTDWENSEKARVTGHENAMEEIRAAAVLGIEPTAAEIEERLQRIRRIFQRDWQEFDPRAQAALAVAEDSLRAALAAARKREADAAELAQLRAAQAERERQDREAIEAKARAEREAKEKAEAEERERQRAAQIEADKQAAAQRAADEAIAAERKRVADEEAAKAAAKAAEEAAEKKRQENRRHRNKIHREITLALSEVLTGNADEAAALIAAIDAGRIPHLSITY